MPLVPLVPRPVKSLCNTPAFFPLNKHFTQSRGECGYTVYCTVYLYEYCQSASHTISYLQLSHTLCKIHKQSDVKERKRRGCDLRERETHP